MPSSKNIAQVSKKVFPEAQDIPRDRSGDLLKNRFGLMMKHDDFHDWRPLDNTKWTFQKHFRCADAHCGLDNDSQSFLAVLYQLKLEE